MTLFLLYVDFLFFIQLDIKALFDPILRSTYNIFFQTNHNHHICKILFISESVSLYKH